MSPALAGRFSTAAPPGKPELCVFKLPSLQYFVTAAQLTETAFHILLISIKVLYYAEINVCIVIEIQIYYFEWNPWTFRNKAQEEKNIILE